MSENSTTNEEDLERFALLTTLALGLGDDETPSAQDLATARELLKEEGGLAYAYRVVDDATLLAGMLTRPESSASAGQDAERFAKSPLAQLLDEVAEEEDGAEEATKDSANIEQRASIAANDDDENAPRAKIIRLFGAASVVLAAAAAVFLFVRIPTDGAEGPGVKGGPTSSAVTAQVLTHVGPLSSDSILKGMQRAQGALQACAKNLEPNASNAGTSLTVSFVVNGQGLVDTTPQMPGVSAGLFKTCVENAIQKAAFDFSRDPTTVSVRLEFLSAPLAK